MLWPPTVTVPVEGVTIPQMMLISVVLPAPFGPSRAKISPLSISRSMRLSAWKPDAYVFVRSETEIIDGMGTGEPRSCQREGRPGRVSRGIDMNRTARVQSQIFVSNHWG